MSGALRICAFRSQGWGYATRLHHLRRRYPDARLVVMIPKGETVSEQEAAYADEVLEQPHETYSIRKPGKLWDLARTLREARLDLFVVMYPSPRLRLVAGLSGARRAECWSYQNLIIALPTRLLPAMAVLGWRIVQGQLRFWRCWLTTRLRRVPMPGEVDKMEARGLRMPRR